MSLYFCGIIGLVITGLLIWITEYYTGTNYRPVKSVAASSTTGHGTNVIQGLAVSMEATASSCINYCCWYFNHKFYCWSLWYCYRCYYNASISWHGCCS
jgi:Na+/H+-translocating membrane pyrophosphatase